MISDEIALHSVQLPLLILIYHRDKAISTLMPIQYRSVAISDNDNNNPSG